jgi:hypothetical protein
MTLCVRGCGSQLIFEFNIAHEDEAPNSCYDHYMDEVRRLAKKLKWPHEAIEHSGLDNDQFTRPVYTRLIAPADKGYQIADNVEGITLTEVIPLLIRTFKSDISGTQDTMHWMLPYYQGGDLIRHWRILRDRKTAFPTEDDWKEFDRNFFTRVEMWDALLWEVNELTKGIPAWSETLLWIERRDAGLLVDDRTVHALAVTDDADVDDDDDDESDEEGHNDSGRHAEDDGDVEIEDTEELGMVTYMFH